MTQDLKLQQLREDIAKICTSRKVRVLVVEDDSATRLLMRDLLSLYNLDVNEAENGNQALEALSLVTYDVVLLDIKLPDIDGLTIHKEIKSKWPLVRVFLCTGHLEWPGLQEALEQGCVRLISKSFLEKSLNELFEPLCVKKLIN